MTDLPALTRLWQNAALLLAVLWLASCNSTPDITGIPSNLPDIPLYGSASTPPHSMSKADYPFDSKGNYVTAWAAEGGPVSPPASERRSSRSGAARPVKSSPSKSAGTKSGSKSGSSGTAKKSSSSGSGSVKHVVKSSDTLSGLARRYGTTSAKIKAANGLKSDLLRDGRTLTIPK